MMLLLNLLFGLGALWAIWLVMGDTRLGRWIDRAEQAQIVRLQKRKAK